MDAVDVIIAVILRPRLRKLNERLEYSYKNELWLAIYKTSIQIEEVHLLINDLLEKKNKSLFPQQAEEKK